MRDEDQNWECRQSEVGQRHGQLRRFFEQHSRRDGLAGSKQIVLAMVGALYRSMANLDRPMIRQGIQGQENLIAFLWLRRSWNPSQI